MHYKKACHYGDTFVLDNIHSICPMINKDAPQNIVEIVKSKKFSSLMQKWVEEGNVKIIGVSRHFSQVN